MDDLWDAALAALAVTIFAVLIIAAGVFVCLTLYALLDNHPEMLWWTIPGTVGCFFLAAFALSASMTL